MQVSRGAKVVLALAALLALAGSFTTAARVPTGPVKNYVVLMMENRAYDHLLGYFQLPQGHLEGLTGQEFNQWNPNEATSRRVTVNNGAKDVRPVLELATAGGYLRCPMTQAQKLTRRLLCCNIRIGPDFARSRPQCEWHHHADLRYCLSHP